MVELITAFDKAIIRRLVELEADAFGAGGMNEWQLVPLIRHGHVYVTRKAGEVIGAVQYMLDWHNPKKAYMIGVSIAKEQRGQGVGTGFIKETFTPLAAEGIEEVELTVDPANAAAVKVYKGKLGFTVTEFRRDEYGDGEDRLVMKLSLKKCK
ncbi:GNAT family N-acetyltransferase [Sporomusa termitida]|uniref:Mycothiol acetyltransferase n=1 Tax=Sporomusa termitida TaxID=2377 RepID=A0A517DQM5_9FIRM|nr:GNAT family N-acetyltransferase [Sporomusa termitida]QDR79662.1 Mycothiol acetyltransferase [Sporomusa termitida]